MREMFAVFIWFFSGESCGQRSASLVLGAFLFFQKRAGDIGPPPPPPFLFLWLLGFGVFRVLAEEGGGRGGEGAVFKFKGARKGKVGAGGHGSFPGLVCLLERGGG